MGYFEIERKLSHYFKGRSVTLLRYAMGIIFFWYGALKVSGDSPVDELVMHALPGIEDHIFISLIGIWEMAIGVFLFFRRFLRYGLILLFLHFPGTFFPLFMQPEACFTWIPFGLTLEGQYIFKNLILISAGLVIFSTLHNQPCERNSPSGLSE
ncbi:MAG: hypothetical protein COT85_04665 [Chlamydiae bacterium CG10_big_fil_rev_8_21_14_0_10_42_34]|nr:MAG: hypothetical protein COT85_04665 [Chlamydiae bacterium CG10_big_fil_rev_8_21_14_0_10_42_34]